MEPVKICLNMIVKNEQKFIKTCLDDYINIVDAISILDTGSNDETINIIKDWSKHNNVPCQVNVDGWYDDFGYSRTKSLNIAIEYIKTLDSGRWYIAFTDPDNLLLDEQNRRQPRLNKMCIPDVDKVSISYKFGTLDFDKTWLIKVDDNRQWKWRYPCHEVLVTVDDWEPSEYRIKDVYIQANTSSNRGDDDQRFIKDALIFEKALLNDPLEPRLLYYLGQSYRDIVSVLEGKTPFIQDKDQIDRHLYKISEYRRRAENVFMQRASLKPFSNWQDEYTYLAWINAAKVRILRKGHDKKTLYMLNKAYQCRPHRFEAPYLLILYYNKEKMYQSAWDIGRRIVELPYPKDTIFVERSVHMYLLQFQASIAAYYTGDKDSFTKLTKYVINCPETDNIIKQHAINNLKRS